ncbi:MAG TPA: hypothetical protein VJA21_11160 [Verrucomicrobiae bacterium]
MNSRRITGKGFGGTKPIASNATEDGNRSPFLNANSPRNTLENRTA